MQFKRELAEKIVRGEKTQTRRPVRPGEGLFSPRHARFEDAVYTAKHRLKWQSGCTYAVQPGRGKPALWYTTDDNGDLCIWPYDHKPDPAQTWQQARILLKEIRCEDVRNIASAEALAEGFETRMQFWWTWIGFYDLPLKKSLSNLPMHNGYPHGLDAFDLFNAAIRKRDDSPYKAWVLKFELANAGRVAR